MLQDTKDSAPPTSERRLREVERKLGLAFPKEYRRFLLQFNGGRPQPDHFVDRRDGLPQWTRIHFLFGIDDPERSCDLLWNYEALRGRLPPGVLPIADDEGGNLFCMDLRKQDSDPILFWDHELESLGSEKALRATVARSFADWLSQLSARA